MLYTLESILIMLVATKAKILCTHTVVLLSLLLVRLGKKNKNKKNLGGT